MGDARDGTAAPGWPPYLTTAEATRYCRFKTTGALRKAAREGRIRPEGRRGGKGTWMWAREELDAFLFGRKLPSDAPVTPPTDDGGEHGRSEMDEAMEQLGEPDAGARHLQTEGRRLSRTGPDEGPGHGQGQGDQTDARRGERSGGPHVARGRAREGQKRSGCGPVSQAALRRLRGVLG